MNRLKRYCDALLDEADVNFFIQMETDSAYDNYCVRCRYYSNGDLMCTNDDSPRRGAHVWEFEWVCPLGELRQ